MYANGEGVVKHLAEAVRLFRLAADQGNAPAQTILGWMYKNGLGVAKELAEAARLNWLPADQVHENAQASLKRLGH